MRWFNFKRRQSKPTPEQLAAQVTEKAKQRRQALKSIHDAAEQARSLRALLDANGIALSVVLKDHHD